MVATAHLCSGALLSGVHLILVGVCCFFTLKIELLSGSVLLGVRDKICLPDIR